MKVEAGKTKWRGKFNTVNLLIKVPCFVTKVNNVSIVKSIRSKLVSTRRSIVLSLPLRQGFPGRRKKIVDTKVVGRMTSC